MKNKNGTVILSAVGDVALFKLKVESMFEHVKPILQAADIKFAQNERLLTYRKDVSAVVDTSKDITSEVSTTGFTELADARNAHVLKEGGFDVMSFASNHSMDLGARVMMETINTLKENGFQVIGAGKNIEEARRAAFVERKGVKVAFLGYCSALRDNYQASEFKPGVAPMRADTFYRPKNYQPGIMPEVFTYAWKDDLAALKEDIEKAKKQADIVAVSIHWGISFTREVSMYMREMAFAAIDAGADVILGHHAHQLKAIEVYKGKPIFYCMGNFAMDIEYEEYLLWRKISPYYRKLTTYSGYGPEPDWPMYNFPPEGRYSMIARCEIEDKKIKKAYFYPVLINPYAQPVPVLRKDKKFEKFLKYVQEITEEQGMKTKFTAEGDTIVIDLT